MFEVPNLADYNIMATLPVMVLALSTCILLLVDLFIPTERKHLTALLAAIALGVTLVLAVLPLFDLVEYGDGPLAFEGTFVADEFSNMVNAAVLITALLGVMVAPNYLERSALQRGEYYSLLLLTTVGVMFMGAAGDLVVVFISLELLSIPLYILSGFRRGSAASEESAMKYFLLGAFSSSFLVYGIALIYGATGTTNLQAIWQTIDALAGQETSARYLLMAGGSMVLVGLGFKVAAVPFHMWTPDVYQGAPTSVVAYMSVAAKIGGFAGLLRVLVAGMPNFVLDGAEVAAWQDTVWILAALTMILGNIIAIVQSDLKRLLAYSSIAHAGYILIALAAGGRAGYGDDAARAALIYLMAYVFTNFGAFAVVIAVEGNDPTHTGLGRVRGLGKTHPMLALAMTVFMLSLVGIPLTAGFIGKWFVFQVAVAAGLTPLAIIGVITSLISAFYYLRVVWLMYFEEGEGEASMPRTLAWAIGISALGTLLFGVLPYLLSDMAREVSLAFGGG
ncbi:MAG: NADH-quinone oxidoreductase subunit N [Chloroflexi bacterium]|nr:NADH-quinone oxidoreductase subunit N [Chloroflexota bacterium]